MRLVRKPARLIVKWRSACLAKTSDVAGATFEASRLRPGKTPPAVLLSYPRGDRRSRRPAAAVTMAMADPVLLAYEFEGTRTTQTVPAKYSIVRHAIALPLLALTSLSLRYQQNAPRRSSRLHFLMGFGNVSQLVFSGSVRPNPRLHPFDRSVCRLPVSVHISAPCHDAGWPQAY